MTEPESPSAGIKPLPPWDGNPSALVTPRTSAANHGQPGMPMSRLSRLFESFRPARSKVEPSHAAHIEIRWVVAGLGNPGEKYRRSRHNLGFMTVQRMAARYNCELTRRKFNGFYTEVPTDAGNTIMVMPQTFYNRSGDCAAAM